MTGCAQGCKREFANAFLFGISTYKYPLSRSSPYRDDLNGDDETTGFSAGICIISFQSTRLGPVAQAA